MTNFPSADPMAFFREMVNQWEKVANDVGAKMAGSSEFSQVMQGTAAVGLKAQQAAHDAMAKALSAANMPSKAEVEALAERLFQIEAQLGRIESLLSDKGPARASPSAPKPKRTKTPPPKAK
jgi:Poly(R)-hydroxyalkanoic acid synthase subunit (PHA_synth_III_E)